MKKHQAKKAITIAYIGGGSRGWAWGLMSDLALEEELTGTVRLYDIEASAAVNNAIIGNELQKQADVLSFWKYEAVPSLEAALTGADFVIISILPGTFDHMDSDVHTPEKYKIYQSVGDTAGPGGLMRALRTIPMYKDIAEAIRDYSPKAWVINYTNPMSICTRTLYRVFPEIKAMGNCHEVFGTQELLAHAVEDILGIKDVQRDDIKVNVIGINHFTWLTKATYKDMDLFPVYAEFVDKYYETGFEREKSGHWMNDHFSSAHRVKFDLFKRYGIIAAAGDRHLAEFCPSTWYLKDAETTASWKFKLTTVAWRKENQGKLLNQSKRLVGGEETFEIKITGEEGVHQIKGLLGLGDFVTNVNVPNTGQIPNLPLGAVVETNALFQRDAVNPVQAGTLPAPVHTMIHHHINNQEAIVEAGLTGNYDLAYQIFINDPLVNMTLSDSKECFDAMLQNTLSAR